MKKATVIVLVFLACGIFLLLHGPDDAQINLKTGALRYRLFHVPYWYSPLSSPYADWLKEISSGADRWITVATFPLPTSNSSDIMCWNFYAKAATWVTVDRKIARAALDDVQHYITSTEARHGLPDSCLLLEHVHFTEGNGSTVDSRWKSDPLVREFLAKHHLNQ